MREENYPPERFRHLSSTQSFLTWKKMSNCQATLHCQSHQSRHGAGHSIEQWTSWFCQSIHSLKLTAGPTKNAGEDFVVVSKILWNTCFSLTCLWGKSFLLCRDEHRTKVDGWETTFLLGTPIFGCKLLVLGRLSDQFVLSQQGGGCKTASQPTPLPGKTAGSACKVQNLIDLWNIFIYICSPPSRPLKKWSWTKKNIIQILICNQQFFFGGPFFWLSWTYSA